MACSPVSKVGGAAAPSAPPVPTPMHHSAQCLCVFLTSTKICTLTKLFICCRVLLSESVFELVSSEDQAKMEATKMQAALAQSQQQKQQLSSTNDDGALASGIPPMESLASSQTVTASDTAAVATASVPSQPSLSSARFMPFAKNPAKQKRYEAYLAAHKAGTQCKSAISSKARVLCQNHMF